MQPRAMELIFRIRHKMRISNLIIMTATVYAAHASAAPPASVARSGGAVSLKLENGTPVSVRDSQQRQFKTPLKY